MKQNIYSSCNFRLLNTAFIIIIGSLLAYLGYKVVVILRKGDAAPLKLMHDRGASVNMPLMLNKVEPYSYYDQQFKKRNIFQLPGEKPRKGPAKISKTVKKEIKKAPDVSKLVKSLKLVGVFLSNGDSEAIVEDLKARETLFLHKGDIVGEFLVKDILEGKIILDFQGQKVELIQ